ncbi:hypothetical protein SGPA1_40972 [Streptomyces misionensis JCM 4497]
MRAAGRGDPQALGRPRGGHPRPRTRRGSARPADGPRGRGPVRGRPSVRAGQAPDRRRRPRRTRPRALLAAPGRGRPPGPARHRRDRHRGAARLHRAVRGPARRPLARPGRRLRLQRRVRHAADARPPGRGPVHPRGRGRDRRRRPDARQAAAAPAQHRPHRTALGPLPRRAGRPRGARDGRRAGGAQGAGRLGRTPRLHLSPARRPRAVRGTTGPGSPARRCSCGPRPCPARGPGR